VGKWLASLSENFYEMIQKISGLRKMCNNDRSFGRILIKVHEIPRVFEISDATKILIKEFHKIPGEVFPVFNRSRTKGGGQDLLAPMLQLFEFIGELGYQFFFQLWCTPRAWSNSDLPRDSKPNIG
jgi:hypothetical protein